MNESVKAVLDNYNGFKEECIRITRLLRKNPKDSYDRYILDTFYPKRCRDYGYIKINGETHIDWEHPVITDKIQGLYEDSECTWWADFPVELFDMTDEEIISWRKENLGY